MAGGDWVRPNMARSKRASTQPTCTPLVRRRARATSVQSTHEPAGDAPRESASKDLSTAPTHAFFHRARLCSTHSLLPTLGRCCFLLFVLYPCVCSSAALSDAR